MVYCLLKGKHGNHCNVKKYCLCFVLMIDTCPDDAIITPKASFLNCLVIYKGFGKQGTRHHKWNGYTSFSI